MSLQVLIKNITPYYNEYKKNQQDLTGAQALEIIWDVGDILKDYLKDKDIAPRTLYHQIYGKSEGDIDITQKSYITRDFLDRAYRVRRIFNNKQEINKLFPTLKRYRLFYKSMPFFDKGRFKMDEPDRKKLVELLNSDKTYNEIINEVSKLRKQIIKLSIPRDSRLKELEDEKKIFITFYNLLYSQLKLKNYKQTINALGNIDIKFIDTLSRNTGALASDSLQFAESVIVDDLADEIKKFTDMIIKLAARKDAKIRRRFRRLIPPEKMIRLSEMIYAVRSEEDFNKFRI
jgi:hypothetical protein